MTTGGAAIPNRRQQAADGLISFVPRLAIELSREPGNRHVAVEGSMLSADISGFTALSEKLAAKGKAGSEEITELINVCFDALIGEAYRQDGEILKFGGDAILVLFRGDDHARRCAAAALTMQRTLHSLASAKKARLTMTVGAHTGVFDTFLVGTGHRELLVTGAEATTVIELEGNAEKGQTLVSAEMLAAVPELASISEYGGGHRIDGILETAAPGPAERHDLDTRGDVLADLIPSAVSSQLGGVLHLGGEHRQLGICFVMMRGVTDFLATVGGDRTADELGNVVDHIITASAAFGTTFLHSDIADHGAKFVLTAGAPTSTGNNADAVLRAALEIARATTPFELRLGVQVGRGFAGFLGSPSRRAYTVMGDPVNTAARMLGKADHRDVIAMDDAIRSTETIFIAEELEPFLVKGKAEPVTAHRVIAPTDEQRRDFRYVDLVGREAELDALDTAFASGGQVVDIVGPAGSGKTRLVDAALQRHDAPALRSSCTQYGAGSPYSVFRPLLRSALGVDLDTDAETTGDILTKVVRADCEHLLPMVPLLAVPFGAEVPSTDEADAIDAEYRRQRLHVALTEFLDEITNGPVTAVVEDVQWIDEASGDLLRHLSDHAAGRPWTILITRREGDSWTPNEGAAVRSLPLTDMSAQEIRRLAIATSHRPLSDTEADTIAERANGNPLFAVELARALSVDAATVIPDSVERLLANRIDELDPASRLYVRMASVLGIEAAISEVQAVVEAEAPGLEPDLTAVSHILEPRGDGRIAFSNALYRDAAYEGLPFKRRKRLHQVVAEYLELSFDEETAAAASASLLSLHYAEADIHEKAWAYGVLAGDLARTQWANTEAAAAYRRALHAADRAPDVDPEVIVRVAETLGDCLFVMGDFAGARRALEKARKVNADDVATELALMRKIGVTAERQGETTQAIRWFSRARRLIPDDVEDHEILRQSSLLSLAHAGLQHRRGDNQGCLTAGREAFVAAVEAGDAHAEAKALARMHLATTYMRRGSDDRLGLRALNLLQELGEHDESALVLNNLGIGAYFKGNWTAAIDYYAESAAERAKAGNTSDLVLASMNTGELLSDQGHWDDAAELLADTMRNCEANGYVTGLAATQLFAGVNERRRQNWAEADELLSAALETFERLGVAELVDDTRSRLAELATFRGDDNVAELEALIDALGPDHPLISRVRWTLGIALATRGDTDAAASLLDAEVDQASGVSRARTMETYLALRPDDERADEWNDEIRATYDSAGVVLMAQLPFVAA